MRIVIDMQAIQTDSRMRAIGISTLAFTQSLVKARGEHEIILALSGLLPDDIDTIRSTFVGLLPQANIRVWHAPGPVREGVQGNDGRRETAELLREAFLASLRPDVIHISNLFEGYLDDALTSIGRFDEATPVSVTLHESQELKHIDTPAWDAFYLRKQMYLERACYIFTTETTARQAILAWETLPSKKPAVANYLVQSTVYERLLGAIAVNVECLDDAEVIGLSRSIVKNERDGIERQLLIDISELCKSNVASGVLQLVRSYLALLMQFPPKGYRVEPVYVIEGDGYRYARHFTLRFLGQEEDQAADMPIRYQRGDVFFSLAMQQQFKLPHAAFYRRMRETGVGIKFLVSDFLPLQLIDTQTGLDARVTRDQWISMITESSGAICLSKSSSEEFKTWIADNTAACAPDFKIYWVDIGCDINELQVMQEQSFKKLTSMLTESGRQCRQLLVDISSLVQKDHKTGIQRVVRSILSKWLLSAPQNYRVEPVYANATHGYRYARQFARQFIGDETAVTVDEPIDYSPGDAFLCLDLNHHVTIDQRSFFEEMRRHGVSLNFVIYDLLPIKFPYFWEPQNNVHRTHEEWLKLVTSLGASVCISKSVADELTEWLKTNSTQPMQKNKIGWFHLGADVESSHPSKGLPPDASVILESITTRPSFVMVGTLEPRKGYSQVLDAFELLWHKGVEVNLMIVGKQGWLVDNLIRRLRIHSELNNRLFWFEGISDEYLEKLYAVSTCLIAASYGEGFGLPLIEAAQHKLPIIARDIPVFREVAGEHAYYFKADQPAELANAIQNWLSDFHKNQYPKSTNMPWLTWKESAKQLLEAMNMSNDKNIN
jgi:glycosyltransferase involved in cell wall biosynthesis